MSTIDDIKLEYQIIGSFINDISTHDFLEKLLIDDFIDTTCKKLFESMKNLKVKNEEITMFQINSISGISFSTIAEISSSIATTATIESDAKLLKDKANRRKLKQKAHLILKMVDDNTKEITEIKNDALKEIQDLEDIVDDEIITLSLAMVETSSVLNERFKNKDDRSCYTGIAKLDTFTAGLHREELTTIGARPGVGKTIIGMQIALSIAKNSKKVMFTSLEMSVTQICERILSANTDIDSLRLRTGNIQDNEWNQIHNAATEYSLDNFLLDKTSRNIQHIRTKVRKYRPDLLVIDYLQLLQSSSKEFSREREVATITRDLKLMSLEFKIPIILLSQLNRNAEGNRPNMADLRESGAIEQDSDNILFLHEPNEEHIKDLISGGVYPISFLEKLESEDSKLSQLIIEKQRNGPVGTIDVIKIPKLMKFVEIGKDFYPTNEKVPW